MGERQFGRHSKRQFGWLRVKNTVVAEMITELIRFQPESVSAIEITHSPRIFYKLIPLPFFFVFFFVIFTGIRCGTDFVL